MKQGSFFNRKFTGAPMVWKIQVIIPYESWWKEKNATEKLLKWEICEVLN
jgi:hypothetical protein